MHARGRNRPSLPEPWDVAGDVLGGDVKGGNGVEFSELEKLGQVGAVILESARLEG